MEVIIATDREVWIAEPELFYIGPWAREDVYDRLINALENNDREVIKSQSPYGAKPSATQRPPGRYNSH